MAIRWPRVLTPTQLSQIIRMQKNPLTALNIFNEAKSKYPNYNHNSYVYDTMITILGQSGRISDMEEVIDKMKRDSCECKDSIFVTAIKTYAAAGLLDRAITLFRNIHEFNCVNWTESFNTILKILVSESKFLAAHQLFLECSYGWEVKSRIKSLNLLMEALCENHRSDLALCVFQEIDFQGCYPNRDSYMILMKGLCQDGRLHEATHLLYSMFWRISQKGNGADIVVYRTLLDSLCDNGKVDEAVEILGKILRKGLKAPKRCSHHIDLSQCGYGVDIEATKQLIHEALVKGGVPNLASYSAIALDLYNEGKIIDADKVLIEMQNRGFRPTASIIEAKICALCRERQVENAMNVIEVDMVGWGCLPSSKVHNVVVNCMCKEKSLDLAIAYLKKISKRPGYVVDKESYLFLLEELCGDGRFLEASQVLEQMSILSFWPNVGLYNKIIKGLCSIGRQYEAVIWLEEMISQGKLPEVSVWTSLAVSFCNSSRTDKYLRTFNHLRIS